MNMTKEQRAEIKVLRHNLGKVQSDFTREARRLDRERTKLCRQHAAALRKNDKDSARRIKRHASVAARFEKRILILEGRIA